MIKLEKVYYPSKELSDYIVSYNFYHVDSSGQHAYMVPEGVIELVFQFGTEISQSEWNSTEWIKREVGFVGGLHKRSFNLKVSNTGTLFSVRFKPGSFSFFTLLPVNCLRDSMVTLDDLWEKTVCIELLEKLHNNCTKSNTIFLIEWFLKKQFKPHNYSYLCLAALDLSKRRIESIEELASKYNLSKSRFRDIFGKVIGCSPKQFSQTRRINSIIQDHGIHGSLTELAFRHGYYDQAHFIHDFKSVTGRKPSEFSKDLLIHEPVVIQAINES